MSSGLIRRKTNEATRVIEQFVEGADALHTHVLEWPPTCPSDAQIVGAERSLAALCGLLARLRHTTLKRTA